MSTTPLIDQRRARIWLALFVSPGDERVGHLVRTLGPVELARRWIAGRSFASGPRARQRETTLRQDYRVLPRRGDIEQTQRILQRRGIEVIIPGDSSWPHALNDLGDSQPLLLCYRGNIRLIQGGASRVAIVGTRRPSSAGTLAAETIARRQIRSGRIIISGGARGIDATAHAAALNVGVPSVAVVAQSPDRPYPPEHRGMFDDIAHNGLVLSEVLPGIRTGPQGFLARNRLIAALAEVTIVVEAPWRSGAMSTAAHAAALDRELVAVTYPVARPQNSGQARVTEQWAGLALKWPE